MKTESSNSIASAVPVEAGAAESAAASPPFLSTRATVVLALATIGLFHAAFLFTPLAGLVGLFLAGLIQLSLQPTGRRTFYLGLAIGIAMYAPQLEFFWRIFGLPAVALWFVLAFWIGLFLLLSRQARLRGGWFVPVLIACLWTGLEYFRSELYYLRFSWLSVGYAFSSSPALANFGGIGLYGIGFLLALTASMVVSLPLKRQIGAQASFLLLLLLVPNWRIESRSPAASAAREIPVAGLQVEFPVALELPEILDRFIADHPTAQLIVLPEYTLDGPVPAPLKNWCRKTKRFLVIGGKEVLNRTEFYDTAFVIGPDGDIVFQQGKSVPIQFFNDGLPATEQKVWNSPWGRIGICICYDLSYSRVTDALIRQGAEALIVPTMDLIEWGRYQHELHGRVGPVRSTEYDVPVFRVASSGVSQLINADGTIQSSLPFPEQNQFIQGTLRLRGNGRVPWDRALSQIAVAVSFCFAAVSLIGGWRRRKTATSRSEPSPAPVS
ncbi:MAG: nitrilase-related carbon-nitrogen hydrolase [Verrucomicrobiota bacterium]